MNRNSLTFLSRASSAALLKRNCDVAGLSGGIPSPAQGLSRLEGSQQETHRRHGRKSARSASRELTGIVCRLIQRNEWGPFDVISSNNFYLFFFELNFHSASYSKLTGIVDVIKKCCRGNKKKFKDFCGFIEFLGIAVEDFTGENF